MRDIVFNDKIPFSFDQLLGEAIKAPQDNPLHGGIQLRDGNCFDFLPSLPDNSVHMVLTDPPYFIDTLDDNWNDKKIKVTNSNTIGNLPAGMKFSPEQSINFGKFFEKVAKEIL